MGTPADFEAHPSGEGSDFQDFGRGGCKIDSGPIFQRARKHVDPIMMARLSYMRVGGVKTVRPMLIDI